MGIRRKKRIIVSVVCILLLATAVYLVQMAGYAHVQHYRDLVAHQAVTSVLRKHADSPGIEGLLKDKLTEEQVCPAYRPYLFAGKDIIFVALEKKSSDYLGSKFIVVIYDKQTHKVQRYISNKGF